MKNNMLEKICTFADECITGNFGDFEICKRDYIDCVYYQRIIARKIEEYNKKYGNGIEVLK